MVIPLAARNFLSSSMWLVLRHYLRLFFFFGCTVWLAGSSSLTGNWTCAPCVRSAESQPLDCRGSPYSWLSLVHTHVLGMAALLPLTSCGQTSNPTLCCCEDVLFHPRKMTRWIEPNFYEQKFKHFTHSWNFEYNRLNRTEETHSFNLVFTNQDSCFANQSLVRVAKLCT